MELKVKQPEAFAIFDNYAELFYRLQSRDIELFPRPDEPLPVTRVIVEDRRESDGWTRYEGWAAAESARLWVSPEKLAFVQVSDSTGLITESIIQPLDRLLYSAEFGVWVRLFVRD